MSDKPKVSSAGQRELDKAAENFKQFEDSVKDMTMDRMAAAPKEDSEPQTKLSNREIQNSKAIYLKPHRTLPCRAKFNEKFREDYEFAKEYVQFIAEHKELIGEDIEIWTKRFAGVPYEEWKVPTNKPVWGPRYLAEQIKSKSYHRLSMRESVVSTAGVGQFYGQMAVDTTIQRLDAIPVNGRKTVFIGASGF